MVRGRITSVNERGFAFMIPDGGDRSVSHYIHISEWRGSRGWREGQAVVGESLMIDGKLRMTECMPVDEIDARTLAELGC